ncbi:MAG: prepilin-type N-terminal cleavage/methylation domain-containing protein [Deltaproteobacteria bacterium]|jgi:general secretion pathway protein I|nr:prepilin-type N-terminal cleavage/methylation domain-containing protein [Deltaproteobacteria bacterium]MCW8893404.1 prepilin-type N-terminal cleavage/methylation domain-containing protein [Deltaproteobacteria bacterium]MCW9050125.1 prepilin-type N-terminal cleavage/methylation domain-containing protein [Deltaproteobacteria bacterium]
MKSAYKDNKGFSLLEVMIALAIVATALVTLLGLSQRSILVQDKIQKLTSATLLAQQLMSDQETAAGRSKNSWELQEDVFPEPFENFRWRISYQDTLISQVKQVTVTVIWGRPEKNEEVQLVSFLPAGDAG